MNLDQHLIWFINAVKASTDDAEVNKENLIKNVADVFKRVKKGVTGGGNDDLFEEFRAKTTLVMVVSCPRVCGLQPLTHCQHFHSLLASIPPTHNSALFAVLRAQKNYRFIAPVMSWLPHDVIEELMVSYFTDNTEVTPLTLAISLELLKALLISIQLGYATTATFSYDLECLSQLVKFFSSKTVSFETESLLKSNGYYYVYLFECLYLLMYGYIGLKVKEPKSYAFLQPWIELWRSEIKESNTVPVLSCAGKHIEQLLKLCQEVMEKVTVEVWLKWFAIVVPQTAAIHRGSSLPHVRDQPRNLQSMFSHIAFDLLTVWQANVHASPLLGQQEAFLDSLRQVAQDPDYDPDQDLSLEQLVEEIGRQDERQEKLLGMLARVEDVFSKEVVRECLLQHGKAASEQTRLHLLHHFIQHAKTSTSPPDTKWLELILELSSSLPGELLLSTVQDHLAAGLDDVLKGEAFQNQLTEVFNQLGGLQCAVAVDRLVWLCLQSGQGVVCQGVRLAVTLAGLVPVMVQALAALPQVCRAHLPTGTTLVTDALLSCLNSGLTGKERQEFISLVKGLLKHKVLPAAEVLEHLVKPNLSVKSSEALDRLTLPLDLLREVVEQDMAAVVKQGPDLVALIVVLAGIVDATAALHGQHYLVTLTLRNLTASLLLRITNKVLEKSQMYEREISLLKQVIAKQKLHPRSISLLSKIVEAEECKESSVDVVLSVLLKLEYGPGHRGSSTLEGSREAAQALMGLTRQEWVLTLLQLLPHCGEAEWTSAAFLTHHVLQAQHPVCQTLQVFEEVMQLVVLCVSSASREEGGPPSLLSLHHCFTCFSSATKVYLAAALGPLPAAEKLTVLATVVRWWCEVVPSLQCHPELPTLFLANTCSLMEEMVAQRAVIVTAHSTGAALAKNSGAAAHQEQGTSDLQRKTQENGADVNGRMSAAGASEHTYMNGIDNNVSVINGQAETIHEIEASKKVLPHRNNNTSEKNVNLPSEAKREESDLQLRTVRMLAGTCGPDTCLGFSHTNHLATSLGKKRFERILIKKLQSKVMAHEWFRQEIEASVLSVIMFVPASNLLSTVASRLKKLYELEV